jgi:hypothetical protein
VTDDARIAGQGILDAAERIGLALDGTPAAEVIGGCLYVAFHFATGGPPRDARRMIEEISGLLTCYEAGPPT